MPATCDIVFDNDQTVYYGGQLLSGSVSLVLTQVETVCGIFVRIRGAANCHWTKTEEYTDRHGKDGTKTISFSRSEEYLNEKTYFIGGENDLLELAATTYNHTFQCQLPHDLPTSCEGMYGYIRYTVEVVLNIPDWTDVPAWIDNEFERSFTVIKLIDLNLDPMMREPAVDRIEKTFYPCYLLCCWPSSPLQIEVSTPVKGYTPGQIVNLKIHAINKNDIVPVTSFTVEFIKEINYFAHELGSYESEIKTEEICIISRKTVGCNCNQQIIIPVNLTLSSTSPTDLTSSSVIKVKHYIKITAAIDDCFLDDEHLLLPITIGTSPILDETNDAPPSFETVMGHASAPPTQSSAPNASSTSSAPSPSNQDPPTYEEAVGSTGCKFKPKYPMYRRATSYSIDLDASEASESNVDES